MSNSIGTIFRLTTYGESHGPQVGGIIDGCPAGLELDIDAIQVQLDRRRPGQSKLTTARDEPDAININSGVFEGMTTGTPIGFHFANKDQRSKDYSEIQKAYRPSHADYTYDQKYGRRDFRGGGRSSARETVNWVAGGAIAAQFLRRHGVSIVAWVDRVADIQCPEIGHVPTIEEIDANLVRCPHPETAGRMEQAIEAIKKEGDTLGGVIKCVVTGVEPGLGDPVFGKLDARLGHAMMGINAVKGFEVGSGFAAVSMKGSEHNDPFTNQDGKIETSTNRSGGIQGGISNGQPIVFSVAFKPVATVMKAQETVDAEGNEAVLAAKGRHDPCVVPRAVPIVESMAALVIADCLLLTRASQL